MLSLELKTLADVGLVRMPSIRKSTYVRFESSYRWARKDVVAHSRRSILSIVGVIRVTNDGTFE